MKQISKTQAIVLGTLGAIALAIIVALVSAFSTYNSLVSKDETVATAWGNLQSQYQRRSDLIPNLVSTVKGYAKHESSTLEEVVNARAKATQITVDADDLSPEKIKQIQESQGQLSAALGKLLAVTENYPQLRANENFSELQAQLEGTENRINESRTLYNESVKDYNVSVRRFPANIVASICGFEKKTQFQAQPGAENAPKVEF